MMFGLKRQKKASSKTFSEYKMEMLVKLGRDQFKKLIRQGINIPVALL
jgi:hypothetical protein